MAGHVASGVVGLPGGFAGWDPGLFLAGGMVQRVIFYVYGFSSVVAIVARLRMNRPGRRWPWLAFAAGLFLFAVADVAFDLYAATGTAIPVPSVADYLYLAAYPVLAWGMVLLVRYRARGADVTSALDGVMVAIGVGVMAWVFVMAPIPMTGPSSLATRLVPIAYPALDLLLVAVVVRLLLSRGVRNSRFRLLAASVVALLVADGVFAFATLHNTYTNGSLINLGWLLSYTLWGAATLASSMSRLTDASSWSEPARSRMALAVLAVAALASPATLIIQDLRGVSTDPALLAACSAVMFVLVLTRLSLLTRALDSSNTQLAQSAGRQVVLTECAVAFVGAGDIESVAQAAVRAATALAGHAESWSSFVVMSPSGPTVVAVAGPAPWEVGDAVREPTSSRYYTAPVMANDRMRGKLVVGPIANGAEAFLPTLGLVCAQMGLALESVEATEERLQARNERQFRSLVQHSSDVVTVIGADGVVQYQSPGVRAVLGRPADGLLGQRLDALIHPDDLSAARAQLTKVLTGGLAASANSECRVSHADGSWREVDTVITNLVDDPDVGAIVLNSRDVTDRRVLEENSTFKHSMTR